MCPLRCCEIRFPLYTEYLEIDYTPLSLKGREKVEDPAIWNLGTSYLGVLDREVGADLPVDREGLLGRPTLERLGVLLMLDRLTLGLLGARVLDRLTLRRDAELPDRRLDPIEEDEVGLLDVRARPLPRETLDRDPTVDLVDPLLLPPGLEERLLPLPRGIVVTRGREVRLRLEEEVKALPVCREGARELTSPRAGVLVREELVAALVREVPLPVEVAWRAPRGALVTLEPPDRALELAGARPARLEVRALEKPPVIPRCALVDSTPRPFPVTTVLRGRL